MCLGSVTSTRVDMRWWPTGTRHKAYRGTRRGGIGFFRLCGKASSYRLRDATEALPPASVISATGDQAHTRKILVISATRVRVEGAGPVVISATRDGERSAKAVRHIGYGPSAVDPCEKHVISATALVERRVISATAPVKGHVITATAQFVISATGMRRDVRQIKGLGQYFRRLTRARASLTFFIY